MSSTQLCKFGEKNQYGVIMCKKCNASCTFQRYCHQDCMWVHTHNYLSCPKINSK
nr:MAG TPA: PHD domain of transcriptional enhancer, Asx [Bacteriophage sp.]